MAETTLIIYSYARKMRLNIIRPSEILLSNFFRRVYVRNLYNGIESASEISLSRKSKFILSNISTLNWRLLN